MGLEDLMGLNNAAEEKKTASPKKADKADKKTESASAPKPKAPDKEQSAKKDTVDISQAYREYKKSISDYIADRKNAAEIQKKLSVASQYQAEYRQAWETAGENVVRKFNREQSKEQLEADGQREELKRAAQTEKNARLGKVKKAENDLSDELQLIQGGEKNAEDLEKHYLAEIQKAENYVIEGFECDDTLSRFIKVSDTKKWLTEKYRNLAALPEAEFCAQWADSPEKLSAMEKKLKSTCFPQVMGNGTTDEKSYKYFSRFVLLGACVLMLLLSVINVVSRVTVFLTIAAIFYIILAIIAKIFKVHKDEKVHNSVSGIIAIIISFVCSSAVSHDFFVANTFYAAKSFIEVLFFGVGAGLMIYFIVSQGFIRKLLMKVPVITIIVYRGLYRSIGKTENKRRADTGIEQLAAGELDAMVVCYLNHQKYLEYLSKDVKEKRIAEYRQKIQDVKEKVEILHGRKAEIDEEMKSVAQMRSDAEQKNRETDKILAQQLKEIDSRYGKSNLPDKTKRQNFAVSDAMAIKSIESKMGLFSDVPQDYKSAMDASEKLVKSLNKRLSDKLEQIDNDLSVINAWTRGENMPLLANEDGTYNYKMEPYFCLFNALNQSSEPIIINHNFNPINLVYKDGTLGEQGGINKVNATILIRELWHGFYKIAPPELLNFAVIDEEGSLRRYLGARRSEIQEFERYYNSGINGEVHENHIKPIRGLFGREDIGKLFEETDKKIERMQDYSKRNSVAESDIVHVNEHMSNSNLHNAEAWDIVFYIIPEKGSDNYGDNDNRKWFEEMLGSYNISAKEYGFIPIILRAQTDIADKWNNIAKQADKLGVTYHVDLSNLTMVKEE